MFCNHAAYNLAKTERRRLMFAVMVKKEIDNERNTDYNKFVLGV